MLSEKDLSASLQAFVDGSNYRAQDVLGVHREKRAEGEGFAFRVWAFLPTRRRPASFISLISSRVLVAKS